MISKVYENSSVWLSIDVEELKDTNFDLHFKRLLLLDYEALIDTWIEFCQSKNMRSTCFILGEFAQNHPQVVKKLSEAGHEIASHGWSHELVYNMEFDVWKSEIRDAKKILEDLCGQSVDGYRSASWSLPFETHYYEALVQEGYSYSSSYFPFKTYLYGHSEDRKAPFEVCTSSGTIWEIPVPKYGIPFSGGFYLRALPIFVQKVLLWRLHSMGVRPIAYIHPYELLDGSLSGYFEDFVKKNKDFWLAFFSTQEPLKKLGALID